MTESQKKLELELKELRRKFIDHAYAYIANVNEDLRLHIEALKSDFTDESGNIVLSHDELDRTFLKGKNALQGKIEAFFDDTIPDHEFSSTYEIDETIGQIAEEMENHLSQDDSESMENTYQNLKYSIDRYKMGVKSEQENIIKILDDEFNLSLVCL